MADVLSGFNINAGSLVAGMGSVTEILTWMIGLVLLVVVGYAITYYLSFKHKVRVREVTNDRVRIVDDKARQFIDKKDGVVKWLLWKHRRDGAMAVPPEDALDLTDKGKLIAECTRSPEGSYVWIKSNRLNHDYAEFKKTDPNFEPFSSEERTMAVYEFLQAEAYKKKKLSELLVGFAPYIAIIMIFLIFMIFYPGFHAEVVAPTVGMAQANTAVAEKMTLAMNTMSEVCLGRPVVPSQTPGSGTPIIPPN